MVSKDMGYFSSQILSANLEEGILHFIFRKKRCVGGNSLNFIIS
jgi:hypothetical protein